MKTKFKFPNASIELKKKSDEIEAFEIYAACGSSVVAPHIHYNMDEVFLIREGHFLFHVDGHDFVVGPGEVVIAKRGVVHGHQHHGDLPSTMFTVCSGQSFLAYISDLENLSQSSANITYEQNELFTKHGIKVIDQ